MEKTRQNQPYAPPQCDPLSEALNDRQRVSVPWIGRILIGLLSILAALEGCAVAVFGWKALTATDAEREVLMKPLLVGVFGVLLFSALAVVLWRKYTRKEESANKSCEVTGDNAPS
jgi:membrane protein implicated in regulation of membrane protease activity